MNRMPKPPHIAPEDEPERDLANETEREEGLEHHRFTIRHDLKKRLDIYLRDRMPNHSRSMLQKLIKSGTVFVNGRAAKASTLLRSGDIVDIQAPPAIERQTEPEDIPLNIVYEDEHFLALNKQADLLVHPARGHWSGTLINGLVHHALQTAGTLSTGSDPWRPGIIHRLDRNTTGLILIAKTDEAHWRLAGQFERRTIHKTYLAVVHGIPPLDSDLIDAPLGIDPHKREKYAVRPDGGRPAQTVFKVLKRWGNFSLLELAPKTGRTHQLRVHLSHIGFPIVGDVLYGGREISQRDITKKREDPGSSIITRQALHAWKLQFVHPTRFTRMTLEASMPPDMTKLLTILESQSR
jgi:23S rRNA pseudouridine1911/1915/1917 synthase